LEKKLVAEKIFFSRKTAFFLGVLLLFLTAFPLHAKEKGEQLSPFVPQTPLMTISEVRPGMEGTLKTVISGTSVSSIPVKILSVIPRKEKPHHLILIQAFGPLADALGGIASGMSGSPVYVGGKLLGAIGYGWEFSDHRFALVTSMEDMLQIWDEKYPEREESFLPNPFSLLSCDLSSFSRDQTLSEDIVLEEVAPRFQVLQGDGFGSRGVEELERQLSLRVEKGLFQAKADFPVSYETSLEPGDAVGALLAWGDVSLGAIGTVSAVDRGNRFLAFAHPFLNRGSVAYPITTAYIHSIIPSVATPFKLGSMGPMVGIITRDTAQGVGGFFGTFGPSVSFELVLKLPRNERVVKKRFHVVHDPHIISGISGAALLGMVDNLWGRRGEGTAFVTLKVDKTSSFPGWERTNMFFSEKDLAQDSLKEVQNFIRIFTTNPFLNIFPLGFSVEVEMTDTSRILYVEGLDVSKTTVEPGEEIDIKLTLRPYRGKPLYKEVRLQIPDDYEGPCEVLVRGGGIAEMGQDAILEGWKSITSMDQFLKELDVMESNNEVVVELVLRNDPSEDKEEEHPFLSSIVASKIEKNMMKIFRTNYYVEGLLRKELQIRKKK
jgi:hypothetical protein